MSIKEFIHAELEKIEVLVVGLKPKLPTVIAVMEKFKGIIDNATIDAIIATFTGGAVEEEIKNAADIALTDLIEGGYIANDVITQTTIEGKLLEFANDIKKYNLLSKHLWVGNLAALIIRAMSGNKLSVNQARQLAEAEFADYQKTPQTA